MLTITLLLIVIACLLLILIVLIQNPKGGGIAANFTAPSQIMGVKRSTDVVEKATWILAIAIISLSLLSNFFRPTGEAENSFESRTKGGNIENVNVQAPPPPPPAANQPAQQQAQPAGQEQK